MMDTPIVDSPYFHKINKFPPISAKFIKFPPIFFQFTLSVLNLCIFASTLFDHDTFMHHALCIPDAPAQVY